MELPRKRVLAALAVLGVLVFSKYFYLASLNSYFTFYLIDKFGLSTREAQLYLFLFLAAVAVGTVVGGPVGDRIGRKIVIWVSILGVAPFTLMLPHANLFWTAVLVVIIGAVLASAFSAIVVYAQELVPGKVGMIAGCSSACRSAWAGWARRRWAGWPTPPASAMSIRSAPTCRCWAWWRSCCRRWAASAPERRCRERVRGCAAQARSRFQATLRSCARAGSMPMISPPSP